MYEPRKSWNWSDAKYQTKGLRIFDFHPVHIYLNLDSMDAMYELKKYGALPEVPKKILDAYKNKHTKGVHTLFYDLLDSLKREQQSTYTISEIVKLWENNV
jgi:hypothetical protein